MPENDVYEKRQLFKKITERYRETARMTFQDVGAVRSEHIKIPDRANVHVVEGGAFVEAVIWISEDDV